MYVATNFTKLKTILVLKCRRKKIWANFQRIVELFTQKYGFGIRDPRSGIRKKPIPDPGSRGQKDTGSRIRIRNTDIYTWVLVSNLPREMENISRGPTFGDFVTLSAQRRRCRTSQLQDYRLTSPPSFKFNVLRESLSVDSQNIPRRTTKEKGVVGNLCIYL
jgi:hypothetical protein